MTWPLIFALLDNSIVLWLPSILFNQHIDTSLKWMGATTQCHLNYSKIANIKDSVKPP